MHNSYIRDTRFEFSERNLYDMNAPYSILIVEDDAPISELLELTLLSPLYVITRVDNIFMQKPFELNELRETVKNMLDKR